MYRKLFNDIKEIKTSLKQSLIEEYLLVETPSPIIVGLTDGIDNNATGGDRSVTFDTRASKEIYKILQSASKWKRNALKKYDFAIGEGIILETTSIRRDANISSTSSLLWDEVTFEWVIDGEKRSIDRLVRAVLDIYDIIKNTLIKNPDLNLPEVPIAYSADELEEMFPKLTPKQREKKAAEQEGVFILTGLGHKLNEGIRHSERPFDTDDWNLNAEIVVWHPKIKKSMSLVTMAYSVDSIILREQAYLAKEEEKLGLKYHQDVINEQLPYTLGGAIFMSRLLMLALNKEHIGEVQISVWKDQDSLKLL